MSDIELLTLGRMNWPHSVISATLATPPGSPSSGDPYIVAASPTGAWSGQATKIARWSGTAWEFQTPALGRAVYNEATGLTLRWNSSAWVNTLTANGSTSLITPPAQRGLAAGTLDDEFESTTIGGSWVFRDVTTGPTNRTPNFGALTENTDLTGATTVPNVSLHTQGRPSWLLMQASTTGPANYWVYKPFTWVAGQFYYARITATHSRGATSSSGGLFMWASSGGLPDTNNRCAIFYDWVNGTVRWSTTVAGTPANVAYNLTEGRGINPLFGIGNPAGVLGGSANWYGEVFTEDGNRQIPAGIGAASFSFTPAFIGFAAVNSPGKPNVTAVDFVRENAGHPLFH